MTTYTLLSIDDIDFSDYSVRGLTVKLNPIGSGELARDVNGGLHDLTLPQFRKYRAVISCSDHEAPPFTDVWRGQTVTVTFIPEVGVTNDTSETTLTISMMVDEWDTSRDEYDAQTSWSLSLVEV